MTPTHPGAGDGTREFCMLDMHFITDLPSQTYFLYSFLLKICIYNTFIIINTPYSSPLQNQFLIQDNLVGKFLFVFFLKVSSGQTISHVTWEVIFYCQQMMLDCACSVTEDMQVDSSGCISDHRGTYLTLPPAQELWLL